MSREYHYWIVSSDENGRPYLIYGCPARDGEDKARMRGLETLSGLDFKIVRYPTRALSAASSFYRGKRLTDGLGLSASAKRQGHEKTARRRVLDRQARYR